MNLILFSCFIILIIYISRSEESSLRRNKACYLAKTCIHTAKERCGIMSDGTVRRFLDNCDILEFNCLKGTDFVKTLVSKCHNHPSIDDQVDNFTVKTLAEDSEEQNLKMDTAEDGGNSDNVDNTTTANVGANKADNTTVSGEVSDDGEAEIPAANDDKTDDAVEDGPTGSDKEDPAGGKVEAADSKGEVLALENGEDPATEQAATGNKPQVLALENGEEPATGEVTTGNKPQVLAQENDKEGVDKTELISGTPAPSDANTGPTAGSIRAMLDLDIAQKY